MNFGRNSLGGEEVVLSESEQFRIGVQQQLDLLNKQGKPQRPPVCPPSLPCGQAHCTSGTMPNTSIWKRKFDGVEPDLESYLNQLDAVGKACGWDEYARGAVLVSSLQEDAIRVMDHLPLGPVSIAFRSFGL